MNSRSITVCRSCLGSLKTLSRAFSTTLPQLKNGPLAVFPATSNAELDEYLLEWRNKVFIPAHCGQTHKRMIRSPQYQRMLEGDDPYYVDVENTLGESESVQLQSISKTTGEPKTKGTMKVLLELLQDRDDWKILPEFWRELHTAGRKLQRNDLEMFIRRATVVGQLPLLLQILRQVDTIGVKAGQTGTILKLLNGTIYHAMNSEWQPKALSQSIKLAEATLKLMHDPRHTVGKVNVAASSPHLYGSVLLLYAARAFLHKQTVEQGLESTAPSAAAEQAESLDFESTTSETEPETEIENEGSSAAEKYGNAEEDILRVHTLAKTLMDLSPNSEGLVSDANSLVCEVSLHSWAPTWAAMQLVPKVLRKDDPISKRIQNAYNGDLGPLVQEWRGVVSGEKTAENSRALAWLANFDSLISGDVTKKAEVMM